MKQLQTSVLGYTVYGGDLSQVPLSKQTVINTLNGHSYTVAKNDSLFKKALNTSDVLLPDGVSVVFAARLLKGQKIQKIAGTDIFIHLLEKLEKEKGSCFFLGASKQTLNLIQERLTAEYPSVGFGAFSPAFKDSFNEVESKLMCDAVNAFNPIVLFVGMTAPKQEKWIYNNKYRLDANIICAIGAVFDFYAGTTERPAQWVLDLKLEWLGRLLKEPKRMWYRYLVSTPEFFVDLFIEKIKNLVTSH
ncbi:MAG: glycosyltransferase [Flavobacteriaceae bacterium]|nr:MAG: glycosyltransferase [Flavobacteriaceae bacterium]